MQKRHSILILGDSYSHMGLWVEAMRERLGGADIVNLGVSSATVRDRESDRVAHPYTSRPMPDDNEGNHNTLACQVEKLKRLMVGTDLDEGEQAIYQTPAEHPDIIILEGGMNDVSDAADVAAGYGQQFTKHMTDVWISNGYEEELRKGDIYIKRPLEEVDRTCFAGAYRYLMETLSGMFPRAQFFFTTASRMGYWFYDVNDVRDKTAAQQRECARLCGAAVIDWNACGAINTVTNCPPGDGTKENPYPNVCLHGPDTDDGMHPNDFGAKKYGALAANMIRLYYLGIDTF